jgi:hypothetical protein
MATASLPPTHGKESTARIGISIGLTVALVALAIFVARLMRRVRPRFITPGPLRHQYLDGNQQRKGMGRLMLVSMPVVRYHEGLHWDGKEKGSRIRESTNHKNTPRRGSPAKYLCSPLSVLPPVAENKEENPFSNGPSVKSPASKTPIQNKQVHPLIHEPTSCSICTEDFRAMENVRILPCTHIYHRRCIDPWLLRFAATCPLW